MYAAGAGAREIVLFGWSMGGAIAMQTVSRSGATDRVRGHRAGRAGASTGATCWTTTPG